MLWVYRTHFWRTMWRIVCQKVVNEFSSRLGDDEFWPDQFFKHCSLLSLTNIHMIIKNRAHVKKNDKHRKGCLTSSKPRKSGSFVYWKGFFFFFWKRIKNSRDKTCCWFTKLAVGSLSISLNSHTKNNFILKHTHRRKLLRERKPCDQHMEYKKKKAVLLIYQTKTKKESQNKY